MPWVTGTQVLEHVRKSSPGADDTAWAATCAAAIDAEVNRRLSDTDIASDDTDGPALAIIPAALQDAAALYASRNAPQGGDAEAAAAAGGPDILRVLVPVLDRAVIPGIG